MDCPHYEAGDKQGKNRPVCRWRNASNNGACNRQDMLMCSIWVAQKLGGKIVKVEEK